MHYKESKYGFEYGNAKVSRLVSDDTDGWVIISIESDKYTNDEDIRVYVTKTGKIRVFAGDCEWHPQIKIIKE